MKKIAIVAVTLIWSLWRGCRSWQTAAVRPLLRIWIFSREDIVFDRGLGYSIVKCQVVWRRNGRQCYFDHPSPPFWKTLNLSMTECFFSNQYAGRSELFRGLSIWEEERYRKLQGTYPVIFLSFAKVKATEYPSMEYAISKIIFEA